jgi:hypothetical protein
VTERSEMSDGIDRICVAAAVWSKIIGQLDLVP